MPPGAWRRDTRLLWLVSWVSLSDITVSAPANLAVSALDDCCPERREAGATPHRPWVVATAPLVLLSWWRLLAERADGPLVS
jgi:hypothetical protein